MKIHVLVLLLDGLMDENGLIEIKCPLSTEHLTAEEAVKTLLL